MAKFVHNSWGDDRHYYIAHNGIGGYTIKQFEKGCLKTELRITRDEKISFENKLKEGGWYEYVRS